MQDIKLQNSFAVTGISLRFPGAETLEDFWTNLSEGKESVQFFTDEELLKHGVDKKLLNNPDFVKTNGGQIRKKEFFDACFFGFTPQEALLLDPQIRHLMEVTYHALEDGGYKVQENNNIGLFVGASSNLNWEILAHLYSLQNNVDEFSSMNLSKKDFISTWISHKLGLTGPSISVQTACSSSLVALDIACKSLLTKECSIAVVGAASILTLNRRGYIHFEGMVYSGDGHCRVFDEKASGITPGEGVAAITIRRLDDALAQSDRIYALIKGISVNNDGDRKVGYHAPSISGQVEVIQQAIRNAGISSSDIDYIETHGTGTLIGDPIEVQSLKKAFGSNHGKKCYLGSVKSNIGHLDTCAGLAGLIKSILILQKKKIPPAINFSIPNPKLDIENSPFLINKELIEFPRKKNKYMAGLSSFGIGGTNAHVILEEFQNIQISQVEKPWKIIHLTAKSKPALEHKVKDLYTYLSMNPEINLSDVSYTLLNGRNFYPFKFTAVVSDIIEAIKILDTADKYEQYFSYDPHPNKNVVFVFSGQGSQYTNMALQLYQNENDFRNTLDDCFALVKQFSNVDIKSVVFTDKDKTDKCILSNQEIVQPLLFSLEYALSKLLIKWGIQPCMLIGYSIGEFVSAALSEVMSLKDAIEMVVVRGQIMQKAPTGKMLSVPLEEKELVPLLPEGITLAVINGPTCIVSGIPEKVEEFEKIMLQKRIICTPLSIGLAGHSALMDDLLDEFKRRILHIQLSEPNIPFISNASGKLIHDKEATSIDYWVRQLREPVKFFYGIQEALRLESPVFIEIGPGQDLSALIRRCKRDTEQELPVVNILRHKSQKLSDDFYLANKIGQLLKYNVSCNWNEYFKGQQRIKVAIPKYPFERQRYWLEGDLSSININNPLNVKVRHSLEVDVQNRQDNKHISTNKYSAVTEYVAPATEIQKEIQLIWQNFFRYNKIGVLDNFFEIGGDSLKAINLINILHEKYKVKIQLKDFFTNPTIEDISSFIDKGQNIQFRGIPMAEKKEYYTLSAAQKRVYTVQELEPDNVMYNMPQFCMLEGKIDHLKVFRVFNMLVERHEGFRTAFILVDGLPVQKIIPGITIEPLVIELNNESEIEKVAKSFVKPFDLRKAPLLRVALLKISDQKYLLMLDMHHIVSDLISYSIIVDEFMALYRDSKLNMQVYQYKDFSEWHRFYLKSSKMKEQEEFWLQEFNTTAVELNLPRDFERPQGISFNGKVLKFRFEKEIFEKLKELGNSTGTTLFMIFISVYYIFLSKLTGQKTIVIGSPATGRRHSDFHNIIGKFVNMLSIKCDVDSELKYSEFLQKVKNKTLQVMDNQDFQFDDLVAKLGIKNKNGRNPLFDVAFSFINTDSELIGKLNNLESDNLKISSLEAVEYNLAKFDLVFHASLAQSHIDGILEYSTNLFRESTVENFAEYLREIMEQIIADKHVILSDIKITTNYSDVIVNEYDIDDGDFSF